MFCGHTVQDGATRRGNVYFIDTCAVFGYTNEGATARHMTMANVAAATSVITDFAQKPNPLINIADGDIPDTEFGVYATIP